MFNKIIEILEKDYAYNSKNDCGFSEFQKLLIKDVLDIVSNLHERVVKPTLAEIITIADLMKIKQTLTMKMKDALPIVRKMRDEKGLTDIDMIDLSIMARQFEFYKNRQKVSKCSL